MLKTKSFKSKDLELLGRTLADWQNSNKIIPKGSIPFFNSKTNEYCLLFFYEEENQKEKKEEKSEPLTPSQYVALKKMGYKDVDLSNMTKQEGWHIINNRLSKNKK